MKVDRLCRKFERILDDNSLYDSGYVKNYCDGTIYPNGNFNGAALNVANNNGGNVNQRRRKDDDCSYASPIVIGVVVGAIIAIVILLLNSSVSA